MSMGKRALTVRPRGGALVPGGQLGKAVAKLQKDEDRAVQAAAKIDRFLLCDASGSMGTLDAIGVDGLPCTRWEALKQAWRVLAPECKGRLAAYTFSDVTVPVRGSASGEVVDLQYAGHGTQMTAAFMAVMVHKHPRLRGMLISDGHSTDGDPTIRALLLGCKVDTVFVGGVGDEEGRRQLYKIAAVTGGEFRDMAGEFSVIKFLEHARAVLRLEEGAKGA